MIINIDNITKYFNSLLLFDKLCIKIDTGSIVSLIGPSGCGKTTLLNIISSIDYPNYGKIKFTHEKKLAIGYMMQDALLLPWRTLSENALLGTEIIPNDYHETKEKFVSYFQAFELSGFEKNYPDGSSGGMKQRVAIIRTLLLKPEILLLDEPFSNLDYDIKLKIQRHLLDFHRQHGTTIILVTHDIEDAIALSDRVIVFSGKPTAIKAEITIDMGLSQRDPVEARKSPKFRDYFVRIWDELKYLNNHEPV